jgi:hypothetical protein
MSQTSDTEIAMQILAAGEERSAYQSGDGTVLGSELWDADENYLVVPAATSISPALLERLGVAIVLEKPGTKLDDFHSSD